MNYYGDSKLLRRSIFSTAGSFGNGKKKHTHIHTHTCFWQQSLTARQLLHGAKGRKTANTHPVSVFRWGPHWVGLWALVEPSHPPHPTPFPCSLILPHRKVTPQQPPDRGRKRHINIWHINNFSVTPVTDPPGRVPGRKCLCSLGSAHST